MLALENYRNIKEHKTQKVIKNVHIFKKQTKKSSDST